MLPYGHIVSKSGQYVLSALLRMQSCLLTLPRKIKQLLAVAFDVVAALISVWLAFSLRLEMLVVPQGMQWVVYMLAIFLAIPIFARFGLYRSIFRYTGFVTMGFVVMAVVCYGLLFMPAVMLAGFEGVPRSVGLIQPMIFLILVIGSRAMAYAVLNGDGLFNSVKSDKRRMLIYGVGSTGIQIAKAIDHSTAYQLVGFLDDNVEYHAKIMHGVPVLPPADIEDIVKRYKVSDILLAMPSISRGRRQKLVNELQHLQVYIKTLPSVDELANGRVNISDIKDVDIEDLLRRDPVPPDPDLIGKNINSKVILVTGAGGSIGSELCRQILRLKPQMVLLLDHSEHNLYNIHQELLKLKANLQREVAIEPLLGDVTNRKRIGEIFGKYTPDTVYHAAAYKHVPLVERNLSVGVRNNVIGTLCVAEAAYKHGTENFILISTDKAVRPANVMGASKRLCEMVLQGLAAESGHQTVFSMVRFGNVLGSNGSVVPLFRQQINDGGPVTLTHKDIIRYFMTIPEAAQLVLQAGAMAKGGDVFLLDMGEPVKIIELARLMIELSGLTVRDSRNPDGDIEIKIVGLRPGEKLYEELLIDDNPRPTPHPRIFKAHEDYLPWHELQEELDKLRKAIIQGNENTLRRLLIRLVNGYEAEKSSEKAMPTTAFFAKGNIADGMKKAQKEYLGV